MKLIYHITILILFTILIPELFVLASIYWTIKLGFHILKIIVKPLVKLGLIDPTNRNVITNHELSSYEKQQASNLQFRKDENRRRQIEIDNARTQAIYEAEQANIYR